MMIAGCSGGSDDPLECQRRFVAAIDLLPAQTGGNLGAPFAAARDRLNALPTDGCTEAQARTIAALAQSAGRAAAAAAPVDAARPGLQPERSPQTGRAFVEFMARIEQFEVRRLAQKRELERMEREGS